MTIGSLPRALIEAIRSRGRHLLLPVVLLLTYAILAGHAGFPNSWQNLFGSDLLPAQDATHSIGSSTQRWKDGTFSGTLTVGGLSGVLTGTLGANDNRLVRTDGTGGSTVQGSAVTLDDAGSLTGILDLTATDQVIGDDGQFDTLTDEAGTGAPSFSQGLTVASAKQITSADATAAAFVALRINNGAAESGFGHGATASNPAIIFGGTSVLVYNSATSGTVNTNLLPGNDGTRDLGSDALRYNSGFFDNTVTTDILEADTIVNEAGTGAPSFSQGLTVADTKTATFGGPVESDAAGGSSLGATNAFLNGTFTGTVQSASHVSTGDSEFRGWLGNGTTQQAVTLGAAATTFAATQSYVVVAADAGGNTLSSITCTGCQESDRLILVKSGTNALTLTHTASPGADQLFLQANLNLDAANTSVTLIRTEGGFWTKEVNRHEGFVSIDYTAITDEPGDGDTSPKEMGALPGVPLTARAALLSINGACTGTAVAAMVKCRPDDKATTGDEFSVWMFDPDARPSGASVWVRLDGSTAQIDCWYSQDPCSAAVGTYDWRVLGYLP